ncbi:MAG: hypothetical protein QOC73_1904 [Actinomycetota bacterium]|nr:hypothetical protein [Actinomycetota bacterium]
MNDLETLTRAIDDLQQRDAGELPDAVACAQVVALRRQIDRLESVFTTRVGVVHTRGAAAAEGYVTTAAFLRHTCRLTAGVARSRVDVALMLQETPQVAKAFADGEISYAHVVMLTTTLKALPPELAAEAVPVLVEAAKLLDTGRLAQTAKRLRHLIDPDGQAGIDERHYERRWLEVATTFAGTVAVNGLLDPESGAMFLTAIDALTGPPAADDERTAAQRRADALVDLARIGLDHAELPDVGGERPHVLVVSTPASLRGDLGAPASELSRVGSIGTETARRLSCDSILTRVIATEPNRLLRAQPEHPAGFDPAQLFRPPRDRSLRVPSDQLLIGHKPERPPGPEPHGLARLTDYRSEVSLPPYEQRMTKLLLDALPPQLRGPCQPLDVGRSERLATPAMRKALMIRDGGCAAPGCHCPPGRLEAHHILHWIDGGVTAVWNLVLLCRRHHRFVHEQGWQITLYPDGTITFTPPLALTG